MANHRTQVERLSLGRAINLRPSDTIWHDQFIWTVLGVDMLGTIDNATITIRLRRNNHRGRPIHRTITREGRLP